MVSPAWSRYRSRHYVQMQGYAPACIGMYLAVGSVGQVWLWGRLGLPHPVADLVNLGVWLGLYAGVLHRYRGVSSWFEGGAKGGGIGAVVWGVALALLALLSLTGFGADHAVAMQMFIGAAWLLLYRSQVGSVFSHYVLAAPTLVLMGLTSMTDPGFSGALLTDSELLGVVGATVAVFGIVDGRLFEDAIKSRVRREGR